MRAFTLFALAVLTVGSAGCTIAAGSLLERRIERTFSVSPGARVVVDLMNWSISTTTTGSGSAVTVTLVERIDAATDREAEALLEPYDIRIEQNGAEVRASARRRARLTRLPWQANRVRIDAVIAAPPDVVLDLQTSGGSIAVRGDRRAAVGARTSGGSIAVDSGEMDLQTSGGSIRVGRAAGMLRARTSGGSISVDHVAASARTVDVATSGGSIRMAVDPGASLDVLAETSGGGVRIDDLPLTGRTSQRSRAAGSLNGGAGRLRARTSGGSIVLAASHP